LIIMSRQDLSLGSRLLLGTMGLLALTGCYIALAKLANGEGSPLWNLLALVIALAVCAGFVGSAFQRPR
jgi:hypothetical protein